MNQKRAEEVRISLQDAKFLFVHSATMKYVKLHPDTRFWVKLYTKFDLPKYA